MTHHIYRHRAGCVAGTAYMWPLGAACHLCMNGRMIHKAWIR